MAKQRVLENLSEREAGTKSQLCSRVRRDVELEGDCWTGLISSPVRTRVPTSVPNKGPLQDLVAWQLTLTNCIPETTWFLSMHETNPLRGFTKIYKSLKIYQFGAKSLELFVLPTSETKLTTYPPFSSLRTVGWCTCWILLSSVPLSLQLISYLKGQESPELPFGMYI